MKREFNERERTRGASQKKERKREEPEGLLKILLAFCSLYAVFLWHMRCKIEKRKPAMGEKKKRKFFCLFVDSFLFFCREREINRRRVSGKRYSVLNHLRIELLLPVKEEILHEGETVVGAWRRDLSPIFHPFLFLFLVPNTLVFHFNLRKELDIQCYL